MSTQIPFDRDEGLIAEGMHYFRITSVDENQGPKGPYFMWHLTVEERSVDNGKDTILNTSLSPQARWKMCEFLDAVQAPPEGTGTPQQFVGHIIRGHVIHEERDERIQATVDSVLPSGLDSLAGAPVVVPVVAPDAPVAEPAPAPDLLAGEGAVSLPEPPEPAALPEAPGPPAPPEDPVPF